MQCRNSLWNSKEKGHAKATPQRRPDPLCKSCPNNHKDKPCQNLCTPMKWINGNVELKEKILNEPPSIHLYQTNYNAKLHELIEDKQTKDTDRLELIRQLTDPKRKMIAACILVGMTQQEIGKQAHISQTRISRLYHTLK